MLVNARTEGRWPTWSPPLGLLLCCCSWRSEALDRRPAEAEVDRDGADRLGQHDLDRADVAAAAPLAPREQLDADDARDLGQLHRRGRARRDVDALDLAVDQDPPDLAADEVRLDRS